MYNCLPKRSTPSRNTHQPLDAVLSTDNSDDETYGGGPRLTMKMSQPLRPVAPDLDPDDAVDDDAIEASLLEDIELEEYDEFGFSMPPGGLVDAIHQYDETFRPKALRREARWARYKSLDPDFYNKKLLKALIRKGIPDSLRREVWTRCLGSQILRDNNPGKFQELADSYVPPTVCDQIELDVRRTFPNNREYRNGEGLNRLRRVLRAFAAYNAKVNYCQAMNFVAAMLLLFMDEDLAFWSLVQLLDSRNNLGMRVTGYYTPGMERLRTDIKVLQFLLDKKVPKSAQALGKFNVELEWICAEWFLCLFSTSLPIRTTLRVWDSLMFEGQKILFRVALAIFKLNEIALSQITTFENFMQFAKSMTKDMVCHNELMKVAFRGLGVVKRREISRLHSIALETIRTPTLSPN